MKKLSALGMVLLFSVQLLHAQGFSVIEKGMMPSTRLGHSIFLAGDHRAIVAGGHVSGFDITATAMVYDILTHTWNTSEMNYPHDGGGIVRLSNGNVLIFGGAGSGSGIGQSPYAEIYDTALKQFVATGTMNEARMFCNGAQLANGKVLVGGNWYHQDAYGELFDTGMANFSVTNPVVVQRSLPLILPTQDGGAMICGGYTIYGGSTYEEVDYYDAESNTISFFSSSLDMGDPGWKVSWFGQFGYAGDRITSDGKYVFVATRLEGAVMQTRLWTFDPASKQFAMLHTVPEIPDYNDLPENTWAISGSLLLSNNRERVYLIVLDAAAPQMAGIATVDLSTGKLTWPAALHPFGYHWYGGSSLVLPGEIDEILITGGSVDGSNFSVTDSFYVIRPEFATAIPEITANGNTLTVYPNPVTDEINLLMSDEIMPAEICIMDMNGQRITVQQFSDAASVTLRTDFLPAGHYIVGAKSRITGTWIHTKFVKQ
jgi:hypothetical protein